MVTDRKGGFTNEGSKCGGFFGWGGCVGESNLWRARVRLRREDGNPVGFGPLMLVLCAAPCSNDPWRKVQTT